MDERAFAALYADAARPLWAYVCRSTGSPAEADDVVQEVFLRVLRDPPAALTAADPHAARAYLVRMATHVVVSRWRRRRRESDRALETLAEPAADAPDLALRRDMSRSFARLTPRERELLWLAYVEGVPHAEIAEALGLARGSIKVLLFRARARLASLLGGRRAPVLPESAP